MEFVHLTYLTGNPAYYQKVPPPTTRGRRPVDTTACLMSHHTSVGGLGDSFYEYLLKAWLMSDKTDTEARKTYDDAIEVKL
ncbi:Mannosyl-oligosaccharide 1,2-alpha-mannosidase IB [Liparis tanakae]|uniref:Mannosyl-oligosaccharide 1,2-alpha-mannosidase IB n=1 Tax=Liparis tanakae TaxID=230148 RepID=A0A4Z2F296_9TELE|nr:Mannosyl-oligosaccharide 1,2-alpha-mannosidase IB [Liparis tanakae]